LHEVHCPGYGQGAQSRQCVQTWRNKIRPLNCMFILEEVFVSHYDREINHQIKYWRKIRHGRTKVLFKEIWWTLTAGAAKTIEADFDRGRNF
jgi:hypothetical protein